MNKIKHSEACFIMKMRVLYATANKKVINYAVAIGEAQDDARANADAIPPAYSCDRERLVVLVVSAGAKLEDKVRLFAGELTAARTSNVAFVFESKDKTLTPAMQQLIDIVKAAGTNAITDNIYFVEGGGLFNKKLSIEERRDIVEWCEALKASIK